MSRRRFVNDIRKGEPLKNINTIYTPETLPERYQQNLLMSDKFRELFIVYLCRAHYGVVQQVDKLMRKLWGVSYKNGVSYLEKKNYTDEDPSKEIKGPRKLIWTINENLISNRTVLEKVYKSLNKQAATMHYKVYMGYGLTQEIDFFQEPKVQEVLFRPDITPEQREDYSKLRNEVIAGFSLDQRRMFKMHISRYQIPDHYDMAQLLWDMKRACMKSQEAVDPMDPLKRIMLTAMPIEPPATVAAPPQVSDLQIQLPQKDND